MKTCSHCGTRWEDDCCFCQRCGAPLPPPPPPYGAAPVPPPRPVYPGAPSSSTYLVFSILATLLGCFFCFPFGLIGIGGIVYASQIEGALGRGDLAGARTAANRSLIFTVLAAASPLIALLFGLLAGFGSIFGWLFW